LEWASIELTRFDILLLLLLGFVVTIGARMILFRETLSAKTLIGGWKEAPEFQVIPSYPHIPKLGIHLRKLPSNRFESQCMLHIRTRDYENFDMLESSFETQTKFFGKNHYALLIFGDKYKQNNTGLQPWQVISLAKKFFYKVGVVVNPTPTERTLDQEMKSLQQKLKENPDFVVTQCVYDIEKTMDFLQAAQISHDQLCINLGYWNDGFPFEKFGMWNPEKLKSPPKQLVDFTLRNCKMLYICGNHSILRNANFPFFLNNSTNS